MERQTVLVGAVAAVVLLAAGGAVALGVVPTGLTGGSGDGAQAADGNANGGDTGGETGGDTGDGDTAETTTAGGGDAPVTTTSGPFGFTVDSVTECGQTCRTMAATVTNDGDSAAEHVRLEITVYAGSDQVWEGTTEVGTLEAGESASTTTEIDVGLGGGAKIRGNDGYATIQTRVVSADDSQVFRDRREVG